MHLSFKKRATHFPKEFIRELDQMELIRAANEHSHSITSLSIIIIMSLVFHNR